MLLNNILLWFILHLCFGSALSEDVTEINVLQREKTTNTIVDLIQESLIQQKWEEDTIPCLDAMLLTLENTKNSTLWAVWILDSIQLPTRHLYGSQYHLSCYDQCLGAPWKSDHGVPTKYCLSDIKLPSSSKIEDIHSNPYTSLKSYIKTRTKLYLRDFSEMIFGVCVPEVCNARAVSKILIVLLKISHLSSVADDAKITVNYCENHSKPVVFTFGLYAFLFTILLLLVTTVFCTIYTEKSVDKEIHKQLSTCFVKELARSFCMERNTKELTSRKRNEIDVINFLRVFLSVLTVGAHQVIFRHPYTYYNGLSIEKIFESKGKLVLHLDCIVNSFFAISGILLTRRLTSRNINPYKIIWKRYIRFVGILALMVFYVCTLYIYVGDGPLWLKFAKHEQEMCIQNGWLTLLLINNYVNVENMCLIPTWYTSADYTLTLFGILMYVAYKKNSLIGIMIFITSFFGSLLYPAIVTYWNEIPATVFHGIGSLVDIRKNIVFQMNYTESHVRASSFLIGIATGIVFASYNPPDYRNFISKKYSMAGIIMAFFLKFYIFKLADKYFREYNHLEVAIYAATNGVIWAATTCVIVLISEYGTLPYLNDFFKWSPLMPLSRLTYGVNMIHVLFIHRVLYSTRNLFSDDLYVWTLDGLGIVGVSFAASYILWLSVEAPLVNVANLIFDRKNPKDIRFDSKGLKENQIKTKDC